MPYYLPKQYGKKALTKLRGGDELILDVVTGANIAYGLRKLRSGYSGNCIKVRRSNDNAELDIGFVGNSLDTTALSNFVGENSAFVTTWYNQSGNMVDGGNLVQTNTARQPRIINAGVYEGGINFLGSTGADKGALLGTGLFVNKTAISMFFNTTPYSSANLGQLMDKNGFNGTMFYTQANNTLRLIMKRATTNVQGTSSFTLNYGQQQKLLVTQNATAGELYRNNTKDSSYSLNSGEGDFGNNSANSLLIGQVSFNDGSYDGLMHEIIFYERVLNTTEINNVNTL